MMNTHKVVFQTNAPQGSIELTSFTEAVLKFLYSDTRFKERKIGWIFWYHAIPNMESGINQRIARVEFYDNKREHVFLVGECTMKDFEKWKILAVVGPRSGKIVFPSQDDTDVAYCTT